MFPIGLVTALLSTGTTSPFLLLTFAVIAAACVITKPSPDIMPRIWLFVLLLSTYLISNGVGYALLAVLMLMPCAAICATQRAQEVCYLVIIGLACVLCYQYLFHKELMYQGRRASWPMMNPNDAATMVNLALIPAFAWLDRTGHAFPALVVLLLTAALATTLSRGGMLSAGIAIAVYIAVMHPRLRIWVGGVLLSGAAVMFALPNARNSIMERFPIWEASYPMISTQGEGLGSYFLMYRQARTEHLTDGFFVHNDLMQFAIELGWPSALIFAGIIVYIFLNTNRKNIVPACAMLSVFLQSLITFPFYVPAISLMTGITYASWSRYGRS